jgi:hypothetical protein
MSIGEYDYEPIRGLPGSLPAGETLLWQGSPAWRPLARRALHARAVATYFALLILWELGRTLYTRAPWAPGLRIAEILLALGTVTVALLCLVAWASARATVYSLTNRRLVIRHGIALPMSLNIPLRLIDRMALSRHADGSGDIALELPRGERIGYLLNWPHVRPWHLAQPQPTLRAIADASRVAALMGRAVGSTGAVTSETARSAAQTASTAGTAGTAASHAA